MDANARPGGTGAGGHQSGWAAAPKVPRDAVSDTPAAAAWRLLFEDDWPRRDVEQLLGRRAVRVAIEAHSWAPALEHLSELGLAGIAPRYVHALLEAVAR